MKKTFEITATKAFRVEPVMLNGKPYVSLRQMYKTRNDPNWIHARQGVNIDREQAREIAKYLLKYAEADTSEYTVQEIQRRSSSGDDQGSAESESTKVRASDKRKAKSRK